MIYYRISATPSIHELPMTMCKLTVINRCLNSFVSHIWKKEKIHFILDNAGQEYLDLVREYFKGVLDFEFTEYGNYKSCLHQFILAKENKDETLFFIEDDYIWQNSFELFKRGVEELGICSPYDHPDIYRDKLHHGKPHEIKKIGDQHWISCESNTMTFGITRKLFLKHYDTFMHYGSVDTDLWHEIGGLWCPVPTIADHFIKND